MATVQRTEIEEHVLVARLTKHLETSFLEVTTAHHEARVRVQQTRDRNDRLGGRESAGAAILG